MRWHRLLVLPFLWYFIGEFNSGPSIYSPREQKSYGPYISEDICLRHQREWASNFKEVMARRIIVQSCLDDGKPRPRPMGWQPWMSLLRLWRLQEVA